MGPEQMWSGGMWFLPIVMPIVMLGVILLCAYLFFGRGFAGPRWHGSCGAYPQERTDLESASEILKKRYARGEITKDEYERMRQDME